MVPDFFRLDPDGTLAALKPPLLCVRLQGFEGHVRAELMNTSGEDVSLMVTFWGWVPYDDDVKRCPSCGTQYISAPDSPTRGRCPICGLAKPPPNNIS